MLAHSVVVLRGIPSLSQMGTSRFENGVVGIALLHNLLFPLAPECEASQFAVFTDEKLRLPLRPELLLQDVLLVVQWVSTQEQKRRYDCVLNMSRVLRRGKTNQSTKTRFLCPRSTQTQLFH